MEILEPIDIGKGKYVIYPNSETVVYIVNDWETIPLHILSGNKEFFDHFGRSITPDEEGLQTGQSNTRLLTASTLI